MYPANYCALSESSGNTWKHLASISLELLLALTAVLSCVAASALLRLLVILFVACQYTSRPPSPRTLHALLRGQAPRVLQLKETVEEAKVEAEEISRLALGRQASQAGRQQPDPATGRVDDQPLDTSMDESVQDNLVK